MVNFIATQSRVSPIKTCAYSWDMCRGRRTIVRCSRDRRRADPDSWGGTFYFPPQRLLDTLSTVRRPWTPWTSRTSSKFWWISTFCCRFWCAPSRTLVRRSRSRRAAFFSAAPTSSSASRFSSRPLRACSVVGAKLNIAPRALQRLPRTSSPERCDRSPSPGSRLRSFRCPVCPAVGWGRYGGCASVCWCKSGLKKYFLAERFERNLKDKVYM